MSDLEEYRVDPFTVVLRPKKVAPEQPAPVTPVPVEQPEPKPRRKE